MDFRAGVIFRVNAKIKEIVSNFIIITFNSETLRNMKECQRVFSVSIYIIYIYVFDNVLVIS